MLVVGGALVSSARTRAGHMRSVVGPICWWTVFRLLFALLLLTTRNGKSLAWGGLVHVTTIASPDRAERRLLAAFGILAKRPAAVSLAFHVCHEYGQLSDIELEQLDSVGAHLWELSSTLSHLPLSLRCSLAVGQKLFEAQCYDDVLVHIDSSYFPSGDIPIVLETVQQSIVTAPAAVVCTSSADGDCDWTFHAFSAVSAWHITTALNIFRFRSTQLTQWQDFWNSLQESMVVTVRHWSSGLVLFAHQDRSLIARNASAALIQFDGEQHSMTIDPSDCSVGIRVLSDVLHTVDEVQAALQSIFHTPEDVQTVALCEPFSLLKWRRRFQQQLRDKLLSMSSGESHVSAATVTRRTVQSTDAKDRIRNLLSDANRALQAAKSQIVNEMSRDGSDVSQQASASSLSLRLRLPLSSDSLLPRVVEVVWMQPEETEPDRLTALLLQWVRVDVSPELSGAVVLRVLCEDWLVAALTDKQLHWAAQQVRSQLAVASQALAMHERPCSQTYLNQLEFVVCRVCELLRSLDLSEVRPSDVLTVSCSSNPLSVSLLQSVRRGVHYQNHATPHRVRGFKIISAENGTCGFTPFAVPIGALLSDSQCGLGSRSWQWYWNSTYSSELLNL